MSARPLRAALALLALAASPVTPARADVIVPAAGVIKAFAFDDKGGWGLEATLDWLRTDCGAAPGLGLIYQYETGSRQLVGVQVFEPGYGAEAGLAIRSGDARTYTLHLAPFLASGVVSGALRFGVPLHTGAAFEFGLVLALKAPWVIEI